MKLTDEEQKVLLALSELEPATLERMADRTGLNTQRLKKVLEALAQKGLLRERDDETRTNEGDAE